MKRRDLLKSCLFAPFVGLFKKKTRSGTKVIADVPKGLTAKDICNMALEKINEPECTPSGDQSQPSSSSHSYKDTPIEFFKELQFGEVFEGKIVSMCTFQDELWVATERDVYRIKERI